VRFRREALAGLEPAGEHDVPVRLAKPAGRVVLAAVALAVSAVLALVAAAGVPGWLPWS
jgi:hypothetical protein